MMNTISFNTRLLADGHLYCPTEFTQQPNARFQVTVTFADPDRENSLASNTMKPRETNPHLGSLLLAYLTAELSLGELAQQLNLTYPETRDWLNRLGIPSLRHLSPELEQFTQDNLFQFMQQRGLHRPE
jgi:hypothetical protein